MFVTVNNQVDTVNLNQQKAYCIYANRWLKQMAKSDYFNRKDEKINSDNLQSTKLTAEKSSSLNINQPLVNMTDVEKAKLLHTLTPVAIGGLLIYINEIALKVIESKPGRIERLLNETISPDRWKVIAEKVHQIISRSFHDLANQSDAFANSLFTDQCKPLVFHCLQEYISLCQNRRFVTGIEYIFEL